MQPRKSTLWSLFLGRPTAFCSWIRTSKSRRMWASCLSSGTRTSWGTAWLEETSASKPACMLGWFVIAWFREKGPTCAVYTVHPRRTSREPKTLADEGWRYRESWILRMFCFTDVCVPPPVITSLVSEDSHIPPFFTSRWIPAAHKELYVCASVIWKFISPQTGLLSPPPSAVLLKARSQTSLLCRDSQKRGAHCQFSSVLSAAFLHFQHLLFRIRFFVCLHMRNSVFLWKHTFLLSRFCLSGC